MLRLPFVVTYHDSRTTLRRAPSRIFLREAHVSCTSRYIVCTLAFRYKLFVFLLLFSLPAHFTLIPATMVLSEHSEEVLFYPTATNDAGLKFTAVFRDQIGLLFSLFIRYVVRSKILCTAELYFTGPKETSSHAENARVHTKILINWRLVTFKAKE